MEINEPLTIDAPYERRIPLSAELKVACEIYKYNLRGEPVWYSKLVKSLDSKKLDRDIDDTIAALFGWGMICNNRVETDDGKAERAFTISRDIEPIVSDLYNAWWKK